LTPYVNEVGQKLAAVSKRKLPYEFVVLNSSVPNAWALPGGKIAVNRGLLTELKNEAELAAVLGHEIVHAAARHGAKAQERGTAGGMAVAQIGLGTSDVNRTWRTAAIQARGVGPSHPDQIWPRAELERICMACYIRSRARRPRRRGVAAGNVCLDRTRTGSRPARIAPAIGRARRANCRTMAELGGSAAIWAPNVSQRAPPRSAG
jgi:hypothetical protein